jgi:uncharacterized membrane protein HdeD (DUF308 family)
METPLLNTIRNSIKHWYLPMIMGVLFILVGIWVSSTPLASYLALSILFAIVFLFSGIIEIIYAISNRNTFDNWIWALISGIIGLLLGILLISNPAISMIVLPFYIGFGILFYSIMGIGRAIDLRKHDRKGWGYLMFTGIVGVIFAFIMIWNPLFGGMTIVFYTAFSFVILGILNILLSIKLRSLNKKLEQ